MNTRAVVSRGEPITAARSERLRAGSSRVDHAYLTIAEVAALLRVKPKTLRNKVAAGIFREGEHFFRKPGLGPRWKRAAVVSWLEGRASEGEIIPMARGSHQRVVARESDQRI